MPNKQLYSALFYTNHLHLELDMMYQPAITTAFVQVLSLLLPWAEITAIWLIHLFDV